MGGTEGFPPGQGSCTGRPTNSGAQAHDDAEERSAMGLMNLVERLGHRSSRQLKRNRVLV